MTHQAQPTEALQVTELWSSCNAAVATLFDAIDGARSALQSAYCQRMAVVMAGLVAAGSPEEHHVWQAEAQRCLAQFHLASAWIAQQTEPALPQSAQSSNA